MVPSKRITINSSSVSLADLRVAYGGPAAVALSSDHKKKVEASNKTITDILKRGKSVYGINTGFGLLARTKIPPDQLTKLQENLITSHMSGVGDYLPDEVVRLVLVLKILSLSKGCSGVRLSLIESLCSLLEAEVYPCIPEKGSVGASGDLAPLAHLAGVLLGLGHVRHGGKEISAAEGLKIAKIDPFIPGPKEGLALLNGTQVSTALALVGLFRIEKVFASAIVAGALSVDAAKGTDVPFDNRIHEARNQNGQIRVGQTLARLLKESPIRASHIDCGRVQDPYCLRCQPQVMGACIDMIDYAATILEREANAVSDNPLVFSQDGKILSGGNFHAEPVALVADALAIAVSEIGSMSERRIAFLMDDNLSGLPAFLVKEGGINSGFMNAQVTAAALASENKQKAHPASVDSIPTSANQEDFVSMATHGARRLLEMAENASGIVAIELLSAAQGIDFHAPLETSGVLLKAHSEIRKKVPFMAEDRPLTPDIISATELVEGELFSGLVPEFISKGTSGS